MEEDIGAKKILKYTLQDFTKPIINLNYEIMNSYFMLSERRACFDITAY